MGLHSLMLCYIFTTADLRGNGTGPTEPGSALGPDWHEGIALRGVEEVK